MAVGLVRMRLLSPSGLFHVGSEVLVTKIVADAWCRNRLAEMIEEPGSEPKKKRGRKRATPAEDDLPQPMGLSTADLL